MKLKQCLQCGLLIQWQMVDSSWYLWHSEPKKFFVSASRNEKTFTTCKCKDVTFKLLHFSQIYIMGWGKVRMIAKSQWKILTKAVVKIYIQCETTLFILYPYIYYFQHIGFKMKDMRGLVILRFANLAADYAMGSWSLITDGQLWW